jgi:hypothetical protein
MCTIQARNSGKSMLFDWSSKYHNYVYHNTVGAVTVLFVCRHRDTVIHSQMLCEWLLYGSCLVTPAWLYVTQCYVNCYYIFVVSSLENNYMYPMLFEWLIWCIQSSINIQSNTTRVLYYLKDNIYMKGGDCRIGLVVPDTPVSATLVLQSCNKQVN